MKKVAVTGVHSEMLRTIIQERDQAVQKSERSLTELAGLLALKFELEGPTRFSQDLDGSIWLEQLSPTPPDEGEG